jgi:hypothetical protein
MAKEQMVPIMSQETWCQLLRANFKELLAQNVRTLTPAVALHIFNDAMERTKIALYPPVPIKEECDPFADPLADPDVKAIKVIEAMESDSGPALPTKADGVDTEGPSQCPILIKPEDMCVATYPHLEYAPGKRRGRPPQGTRTFIHKDCRSWILYRLL